MSIRAYLFDADGADREVKLDEKLVKGLTDQQLLWVDVTSWDQAELNQISSLLHLHRESVKNLVNPIGRPRLDNYGQYFQVNVIAVSEVDHRYEPIALDLFSGPNYIVTVHPEPIEFLHDFEDQVRGDTQIGQLNEAAFLATLLEWQVTSYFRVLHGIEADVDRLDELALLEHGDREFLGKLVRLRRRVAELRRLLTPHREARIQVVSATRLSIH